MFNLSAFFCVHYDNIFTRYLFLSAQCTAEFDTQKITCTQPHTKRSMLYNTLVDGCIIIIVLFLSAPKTTHHRHHQPSYTKVCAGARPVFRMLRAMTQAGSSTRTPASKCTARPPPKKHSAGSRYCYEHPQPTGPYPLLKQTHSTKRNTNSSDVREVYSERKKQRASNNEYQQ